MSSRPRALIVTLVTALLVISTVAIRNNDLDDILSGADIHVDDAEAFGDVLVAKEYQNQTSSLASTQVVAADVKASGGNGEKQDGKELPSPAGMPPSVAGVAAGVVEAPAPERMNITIPEERRDMSGWLRDIAGGTGASISVTGDSRIDQALLRRMRSQDRAVMLLLLLAYGGALFFSCTVAYRQAANDSTITYYADPRYHSLTTELEEVDAFLDAFNQNPKDAQLQVTGFVRLPPLPDYVVEVNRHRVAFSFALDLTPWLVRDGASRNDDHNTSMGVNPEDKEKLADFLAHNSNDLSYVELQKDVAWKDWEELATNIKSLIRERGFEGVISVRRNSQELVNVHKNKQWANFMHSRTTKVLLALSIFGWFLHATYMWLRNDALTVRCKYRVDIGINEYWSLISDSIGANGFTSGVPAPTLPPTQAGGTTTQPSTRSVPNSGVPAPTMAPSGLLSSMT